MFGLYARLAVAAAIALALAGTHWKAYTKGRDVVRAEWALDVAERTAAALAASEAARKAEQELQAKNDILRGKYADQIKAVRTVADAAGVGMRDLQQALAGPVAAASASPTARADDASRARIVVGACAREVQGMAALLDEREQQLIALQAYVRTVQQTKP